MAASLNMHAHGWLMDAQSFSRCVQASSILTWVSLSRPAVSGTDNAALGRIADEGTRQKMPEGRSVVEAAALILARVDEGTRENSGGQFLRSEGPKWPW